MDYCELGNGVKMPLLGFGVFQIPDHAECERILTEIGAKYHKSAAQVALRFLVQSGISAIPKASSRDHMEQNFAVFDFALSAEDMEQITKLDTGSSLFVNHSDPNFVKYITSLKA